MDGRQILILGATSAIGQAYARRRAAERAAFILVGRSEERLSAIGADLLACGATAVHTFVTDLAEIPNIEQSTHALRAHFGEPDEVLIAYGLLGEQESAELDLASARNLFDTNLTSPALWILALLRDRRADAPLTIVAIGSVAGDRGRASNFIYGAGKGGLDRFLEGLAQKYDGTPVRIITIKPGFVDTPMTAAIKKDGPLWATPDRIAGDIDQAVAKGKRLVYTPGYWWPIMMIIRHLPWFLFKRLKI